MAWDTIDSMRDLLRVSLGRSLRTLSPLDRLHAAWPVACGSALAGHGELTALEDGTLTVRVADPAWRRQFLALEGRLLADLRRIAAVNLTAIHFRGDETVSPAASAATRRPAQPPSRTSSRTSSRSPRRSSS